MKKHCKRKDESEDVVHAAIDLGSSPAAKFLAQMKPWELQQSPVNLKAPAAVPFKWEEVPGKPKSINPPPFAKPKTTLHPPPRLLQPASRTKPNNNNRDSSSATLHSRCNSECEEKQILSLSKIVHFLRSFKYRSSSSSLSFTADKDTDTDFKRVEESESSSPGCRISSLDFKLYSPFRGLGPPEAERRREFWRRKPRQKTREKQQQNQLFNARIAAAVGVHCIQDVDVHMDHKGNAKYVNPKHFSKSDSCFPVAFPRRYRRKLVLKRRSSMGSLLMSLCRTVNRSLIGTRQSQVRKEGSSIRLSYTLLH